MRTPCRLPNWPPPRFPSIRDSECDILRRHRTIHPLTHAYYYHLRRGQDDASRRKNSVVRYSTAARKTNLPGSMGTGPQNTIHTGQRGPDAPSHRGKSGCKKQNSNPAMLVGSQTNKLPPIAGDMDRPPSELQKTRRLHLV